MQNMRQASLFCIKMSYQVNFPKKGRREGTQRQTSHSCYLSKRQKKVILGVCPKLWEFISNHSIDFNVKAEVLSNVLELDEIRNVERALDHGVVRAHHLREDHVITVTYKK